MAVRIGKPAPEFEAEAWTRGAHGPKKVGLSQHRGKWVVLFFYPRDFTFICPTEIASFGAIQKDFERENGVVIGVSTDSFYTHKAWFESDPRLANILFTDFFACIQWIKFRAIRTSSRGSSAVLSRCLHH